MSYPEDWSCPVCGAKVSGVKCPVCGYQPPPESGELSPEVKSFPFRERLLAFIIDLLIISGLAVLFAFVFAYAFNDGFTPVSVLFKAYLTPFLLLFWLLHPFYFLFFEFFYESTIGKHLMGLKLVFSKPKLSSVLIRNLSRFIEFIPLYIPSVILVKRSGLRWGDKLAGSSVVFK